MQVSLPEDLKNNFISTTTSNKIIVETIKILQKKTKKKCLNFKNWNEIDDSLLRRLFGNYGNKWKIIAKYFPTRTPYQLSYRMKTLKEKDDKKQQKKFKTEKCQEIIMPSKNSKDSDDESKTPDFSNENDSDAKIQQKIFSSSENEIKNYEKNEKIENSFFKKLNYINSLLKYHGKKSDAFSDLDLNENKNKNENENKNKMKKNF